MKHDIKLHNGIWTAVVWGLALCWTNTNVAQVSIPSFGTAVMEDFNTLALTGTSSVVPAGWAFSEAGTNMNTTYTADTGSGPAGDTYSFGSASSSERAFGGLQSGSLIPTIGASFTNNTGATISSLSISYRGEQWRLGAVDRVDRLDFQYSLNATSLTTGTWTDVNTLDFTAPFTNGTLGALDGNAAPNFTVATSTITGLTIPNGATFLIRWNDFNATGADDGLSVDNFSISACPVADAGTYGPVCTNDANVTLTGLPSGGTWSGAGIVNGNQFDPSAGTQTLTYTYNPGNGCTGSDEVTIAVSQCLTSPEMRWVVLNDNDDIYGTCVSRSDCDLDTLCFGLQYTPDTSGILTSYSTGFFMPCLNGLNPVNYHKSCVMLTNDQTQNFCSGFNMVTWNFSGNTGSIMVTKEVPVIIHQACFSIPNSGSITLTEDTFFDLSTSIIFPDNSASTEYPSYIPFTFDSVLYCGVLPVRLLSFEAKKSGELTSHLTWETTEEFNNSHFEIQRSNDSGRSFETIGRVEAVSISRAINAYDFTDHIARPGVNHYRLKQWDHDGKFEYSPFRAVTFTTEKFSITAWPNPVNELLNVYVSRAGTAGQLRLIDLSGRELTKINFPDGDSNLELDVNGLAPGLYSLVVISGTDSFVEKIVIME